MAMFIMIFLFTYSIIITLMYFNKRNNTFKSDFLVAFCIKNKVAIATTLVQ